MPGMRASSAEAAQAIESRLSRTASRISASQTESRSSSSAGLRRSRSNAARETSDAIQRVEACLDLEKSDGDYVQILSIMMHHAYSCDVIRAGLGALVKIFEHNVPSVFDDIGAYVSPEKTKRLLKDFASKVSDAGMILHAVRGIGRHVNDREVCEKGCRVVRYLLRADKYRDQFVQNAAAKAMQRHEADPRVQREACIALVKLAWDNARIEELGELGAVSACLRAMQTHEKNESVQTPGWRLLSHMAQTKKNAEIITQEGGVKVIVKAMAAREGDQAMQVRGCNTIQRMADNDSERTKETIAQSGGLLAILNALKTHGADADAQAKGCAAIAAIASNENARSGIIKEKGLETCLEAMKLHKEHAMTQREACLAIDSLASTPQSRKRIMELGGVTLIVDAMRAHVNDEVVCENACRCLMQLAMDPPLAIAVGQEPFVHHLIAQVMRKHAENPNVQDEACWVIIFLTNHKGHEEDFVKQGVVNLVVTACKRHFDHASLQEQGRMALDSLGKSGRAARLALDQGTDIPVAETSACCAIM